MARALVVNALTLVLGITLATTSNAISLTRGDLLIAAEIGFGEANGLITQIDRTGDVDGGGFFVPLPPQVGGSPGIGYGRLNGLDFDSAGNIVTSVFSFAPAADEPSLYELQRFDVNGNLLSEQVPPVSGRFAIDRNSDQILIASRSDIYRIDSDGSFVDVFSASQASCFSCDISQLTVAPNLDVILFVENYNARSSELL